MKVEKANAASQNKSGDSDDLAEEYEKNKEILAEAEMRKGFLLMQIKSQAGTFASFK